MCLARDACVLEGRSGRDDKLCAWHQTRRHLRAQVTCLLLWAKDTLASTLERRRLQKASMCSWLACNLKPVLLPTSPTHDQRAPDCALTAAGAPRGVAAHVPDQPADQTTHGQPAPDRALTGAGRRAGAQRMYQTNLLIAGWDEKAGPSLFWLDYLATMHAMNVAGTGYGALPASHALRTRLLS